ncbi:hypothetical protein CONLIGDRAFT_142033 [Coniochaeta ligniaria NRRL 30616]|uniref:Ubiquitin-like protease family profile domain-containing protein n=1 Tax=Coniochaeta ligniaria NRRL 30616 TaxID=1408157 RepID=A0A1J7J6Z5_9PEZI|nr:hypothetical protein CONLIGDRAFT_142033 [Coniochaeta ligniaria NRRL 30616]
MRRQQGMTPPPRPPTPGPATRSQSVERLVSLPEKRLSQGNTLLEVHLNAASPPQAPTPSRTPTQPQTPSPAQSLSTIAKRMGAKIATPPVPVWPAWEPRASKNGNAMQRRLSNKGDSASEDNVDAPNDSETAEIPELSTEEALAAVRTASEPGQQKMAWRTLIWSYASNREHPWKFPEWVLGKLDEDIIHQCLMAEFGDVAMNKTWIKAYGSGKLVATVARFLDVQFPGNLALWFGADGIQSPTPETLRILIGVYNVDTDTDAQVAKLAGQWFDYKGLIQTYAGRLNLDMGNRKHRHGCIFARSTLKRRGNQKAVRLAPKDIRQPNRTSNLSSTVIPGYKTVGKFQNTVNNSYAATSGSNGAPTADTAGKDNVIVVATEAGMSAVQTDKVTTNGDREDSSAHAVPAAKNLQGHAAHSTTQPMTPLSYHKDDRARRVKSPILRVSRDVTTSRSSASPVMPWDDTPGSPGSVGTAATSPESMVSALGRHSPVLKRRADNLLEMLSPKRHHIFDTRQELMPPNDRSNMPNYITVRSTINPFMESTAKAVLPWQDGTKAANAPPPLSNELALATTPQAVPPTTKAVSPCYEDPKTAKAPSPLSNEDAPAPATISLSISPTTKSPRQEMTRAPTAPSPLSNELVLATTPPSTSLTTNLPCQEVTEAATSPSTLTNGPPLANTTPSTLPTIKVVPPCQGDTEAATAPSPLSNGSPLASAIPPAAPVQSETVISIEDDIGTAETPPLTPRRERDPFLELSATDLETLASPTGWLTGSIMDTFLTCFASARESCGTISGLNLTHPRSEDSILRAKFLQGSDGTPVTTIILYLQSAPFHWVATWIDTAQKRASLYDSRPAPVDPKPHFPRRVTEHLDNLRRLLPQESRDFEIVQATCPRQSDMDSCGVYTLAVSCHLTAGCTMPDTIDPLLWRWIFLAMARNTTLHAVLCDVDPGLVDVSAEVEVITERQQQPMPGVATTLAKTTHAIETAARCVEACISEYRARADRAASVQQRIKDEVQPVLTALAESATSQTSYLGKRADDERHNTEAWKVILAKAQSLRPKGNAVVELEATRNFRLSGVVRLGSCDVVVRLVGRQSRREVTP